MPPLSYTFGALHVRVGVVINSLITLSKGLPPHLSMPFCLQTDRVFDPSSGTQDVYEEFGRPIVTSAMEGINGALRLHQSLQDPGLRSRTLKLLHVCYRA